MKKIVLLFTVLFSYFSYAQTGDPKVDAMLRELQKAPGKITFMMNGKTMNEVASFVEDAKKGLLISSHLTLDTTPDVFISLIAPSKKTGIYSIDDNKKAGVLQINQKAYQIRGTINLKVSGKKITALSATFTIYDKNGNVTGNAADFIADSDLTQVYAGGITTASTSG